MTLEKEFAAYLKNNSGFERFVGALRENYAILGHLGGTIRFTNLTEEERKAFEELFETKIRSRGYFRLFYKTLLKQLEGTKFENADLLKVLELYYDTPIMTNKELKTQREKNFENAKKELQKKYKNTFVEEWLAYRKESNVMLYEKCIRELQRDKETIFLCLDAINQLPIHTNEKMSLPVFAYNITKDPHFFDRDFPATILYDVAFYFANENKMHASHLLRNKMLTKIGLVKEETINYTTVSRLFATNTDGNVHAGLSYFSKNYEPFNLRVGNLLNIAEIKKIDHVVIFESPSVFQNLNDYVKNLQLENIGIVCNNEEMNLATHLLLEKIHASGVQMHYAGNFSIKGLMLAEKLKRQFKEQLNLLCYESQHYHKSQSIIEPKRARIKNLTALEFCEDVGLQAIKELLEEIGYSGHQKTLIEDYKAELLKLSKESAVK